MKEDLNKIGLIHSLFIFDLLINAGAIYLALTGEWHIYNIEPGVAVFIALVDIIFSIILFSYYVLAHERVIINGTKNNEVIAVIGTKKTDIKQLTDIKLGPEEPDPAFYEQREFDRNKL